MNRYNIIIADDNVNFTKNLYKYLKQISSIINVVAIVENGKQLLGQLYKHHIDLIILDLNMPQMNGIETLNQISNSLKINFKILIISGNNELLNKITLSNYTMISKILVKPLRLKDIYSSLIEIIELQNTVRIEEKIQDLLSSFNFNRTSKGYTYIYKCIIKSIENENLLYNIQNSLYSEIAKETNETICHIKWSIQKSINVMIKNTNSDVLDKYFPYCPKITSKVFIKEIIRILKRSCN